MATENSDSIENTSDGTNENADAEHAVSAADSSAFTKNVTGKSDASDGENRTNSEEPDSEILSDKIESGSREEVPALLGGKPLSENEIADTAPDLVSEATIAVDSAHAASDKNIPDSATSDLESSCNQQILDDAVKPEITNAELVALNIDTSTIQETLKDALYKTHYISTKIDTVSSDTDCLIKQVNSLSTKYELLFAEVESISSGANSKGTLSNTYLTISSAVLVLLVISQIYMATSLFNAQRVKHGTDSHGMGNMSSSAKKTVGSENKATALEHAPRQEHAQPHPATTVKTDHDLPVHDEVKSTHVTPVLEKMNKLRNGLLEKKLIRKETGDWFVYNKKIEDCLFDTDVIETLNQAYKKAGRSLSTTIPLPAHNVLCILKPDGKGGTEIVITQNFVP